MKKQLGEMAKKLAEVHNVFLEVEERYDTQAINISLVELEADKLLEKLKERNKALDENKQLLKVQETQHKKAMNEVCF